MPYIGKIPAIGNYQVLDALTATTTATYALTKNSVAVYPQTPANCIVSLNGVIQAPFDSYTISGSNIVFASALTASDSIDFITVLGDVLNVGTVSDGTIGISKLSATGTKDSTTFLRGDNTFAVPAGGVNTPIVYVKANAASITNLTTQKVAMDNEIIDTANAYDPTTNYRFTVPTGQGGKYYINFAAEIFETADTLNTTQAMIYKNGSLYASGQQIDAGNNHAAMRPSVDAIVSLVATDYIEFYIYVNGTDDLSANTSATIFKLME